MRIRCRLFGCKIDFYDTGCECCGSNVYDYDFYHHGIIRDLLLRWQVFTSWCVEWAVGRRCEVCGGRLSKREQWTHDDPNCASQWIPF